MKLDNINLPGSTNREEHRKDNSGGSGRTPGDDKYAFMDFSNKFYSQSEEPYAGAMVATRYGLSEIRNILSTYKMAANFFKNSGLAAGDLSSITSWMSNGMNLADALADILPFIDRAMFEKLEFIQREVNELIAIQAIIRFRIKYLKREMLNMYQSRHNLGHTVASISDLVLSSSLRLSIQGHFSRIMSLKGAFEGIKEKKTLDAIEASVDSVDNIVATQQDTVKALTNLIKEDTLRNAWLGSEIMVLTRFVIEIGDRINQMNERYKNEFNKH